MHYSLENLEKKFQEHSKSFKQSIERDKKAREENGWEPLEYDDFCLPDALVSIIHEIQKLKRQ